MSDHPHLLRPVLERAATRPEHPCLVYIGDDGSRVPVTAGQLHAGALAWAHVFQDAGVGRDDIVLLVLGHSLELFFSFWGALYLGALPSIHAQPTARVDPAAHAQQIVHLVAHAGVTAVVAPAEMGEGLAGPLAALECRFLPAGAAAPSPHRPPPMAIDAGAFAPDKVAFLQFSSGTTGARKGVPVTHRAVLAQVAAISRHVDIRPDDVVVSWLPLYHDMGLVACFLLPIVQGVKTVLMSAGHWALTPKTMLRAVHEYRGTHSWMPNFAFRHMVRVIRPRDIEGVDLSGWRMVLSGAEPIRYEALRAFAEWLRPYGFQETALKAGYGMAENTLGIAGTPHDEPLRLEWIDVKQLQENRLAVPAAADASGSVLFVSSGRRLSGTDLIVVDDTLRRLGERQVGEFWIRGDSLFAGYHRRPDLTAEVFRDGWFRTGDLGYVAEGDVFVTGRKKDLIVAGGKNIHPEDIEEIADRVPAVYHSVAFGHYQERLGTEGVVLVCEAPQSLAEAEKQNLAAELRQRIAQRTDVVLADVRLVKRRWILKSANGKMARAANRQKYLEEFVVP